MTTIWDRLGVLTDEVSDDLHEALDWAVQQGLKHVEIRMVNGRNAMDLSPSEHEQIRREVEKRGLFVSALASPIFKCSLDLNRPVAIGDTFGQREETIEEHFIKLEKAFAIADALGTNKIRIFSFWRETCPKQHFGEIVLHLRKAAQMAEQSGKLLMLENEPACNGGGAREVAELAAKVNSKALRILWDPGNECYFGHRAYPDGFHQIKDWFVHVHLKDAIHAANGEARFVPIHHGQVDYDEQFRALQKVKYQGLFTIESHYIPPGGTQMDGTAETLRGLRKLLGKS